MILCIHQPPAASSASPRTRQAQPSSLPTRKPRDARIGQCQQGREAQWQEAEGQRGRPGLRGLSSDLTGERGRAPQVRRRRCRTGAGWRARWSRPARTASATTTSPTSVAAVAQRPAASGECAAPIDRAQDGGQVGTGEPSASRRPLERLEERRPGSEAGRDLVRHRGPRRRHGPRVGAAPPNGRRRRVEEPRRARAPQAGGHLMPRRGAAGSTSGRHLQGGSERATPSGAPPLRRATAPVTTAPAGARGPHHVGAASESAVAILAARPADLDDLGHDARPSRPRPRWTTTSIERRTWSRTVDGGQAGAPISTIAVDAAQRVLRTVAVAGGEGAVVAGVEGHDHVERLRRPAPRRRRAGPAEGGARRAPTTARSPRRRLRRTAAETPAGRRAGVARRSSAASSMVTTRSPGGTCPRSALRNVVFPEEVAPLTTRLARARTSATGARRPEPGRRP